MEVPLATLRMPRFSIPFLSLVDKPLSGWILEGEYSNGGVVSEALLLSVRDLRRENRDGVC